jgi:hypothetical protein
MTSYAELRLRIDRGVGRGSYRITANGPGGEALGRFRLPFSELELENFILKVGATRRGRRRIESPEMQLAKGFGSKLFDAVFEGDVRELYRSSLAETRSTGNGLRLTLSLTGAPELLQIPWEYLYDHPSFLSISTWTPIVRYLDLPKPRRPLEVSLPLHILAMVSAPSDAESIDAGDERRKLEAALRSLLDVGAVTIDWLEEASLRALQRQLRQADYHVFHFIGHGGYDHDADDGVLLFEDEQNRGRRISGIQLGTILADETTLRLAVLNSCEGARSSVQDPFSGVATSLIEREIPAVIGMQFEITDRAAIVFAGEFYSALADGLAVDSAVAEARKAIYADENDIEWGTPVLFMRVADGRLFDVQERSVAPPAEPIREVMDVEPAPGDAEKPDPGEEQTAAIVSDAPDTPETDAQPTSVDIDDVATASRVEASAQAVADEVHSPELEVDPDSPTADEPAAVNVIEPETIAAPIAAEAAVDEQVTEGQPEPRVLQDVSDSAPAEPWISEQDVAAFTAPGARPTSSPARSSIARAVSTGWARRFSGTASDVATIDIVDVTARAALGAILVVPVAYGVALVLTGTSGDLAIGLVLAVIVFVVAVVAAETAWPSIRVPGGRMYRYVNHNPLVASAIEGGIVGATVGYVIFSLALGLSLAPTPLIISTALTAVAFAVAEGAILWFHRRRG